MRTDAKIGFAIFGVLLLVLAVYGIVGHRHTKPPLNTVALVPGPSSDAVNPVTSEPPVSVPPVDATPAPVATPQVPPVAAPPAPEAPKLPVVDANAAAHAPGMSLPDANTAAPSVARNSSTRLPADEFPIPGADRSRRSGHAQLTQRHHAATGSGLDEDDPRTTASAHQYTVKPGQTLSSIALDVYGNTRFWHSIQDANHDLNPARLKVGTKINLPDISVVRPEPNVITASSETLATGPDAAGLATYEVQRGDSLYRIAKKLYGNGRRADAIYQMNKSAIGADEGRLKLGMVLRLPAVATAAALSDASR